MGLKKTQRHSKGLKSSAKFLHTLVERLHAHLGVHRRPLESRPFPPHITSHPPQSCHIIQESLEMRDDANILSIASQFPAAVAGSPSNISAFA